MRLALVILALPLTACPKSSTVDLPPSPSASDSASASASASGSDSASLAPPLPNFKSFPNTPAGAKSLVTALATPNLDAPAATILLRPSPADYKSLFDPATATKIDTLYSPEWDRGSFVIVVRPGQTDIKMFAATPADFKAANDKSKDFPNYQRIAPHMIGGATWYRFRFVEPGQEGGNTYDGLVYVNSHWVLIPKPWRGLDDH